MKIKVILSALFLFGYILSFASTTGYGGWIWMRGQLSPNTWMSFRKDFSVTGVPKNCLVTIAADSKYWLWVNGQMVVREGGLKRTAGPHDTYADTVRLDSFLKSGKNTIALMVWYWGKEGHGHISSGHGGLYFNLPLKQRVITSDASWKVRQIAAFDTTLSGSQPYRPLSEFNITYDARKEEPNWFGASYNDEQWDNAEVLGEPPCKPWGNLVVRPTPQWKDYGLKEYRNSTKGISIGNINNMILPYNAQITPYFKIKAKAGLMVSIRTDKYTDGGSYNLRADYITKDGVQEYESPGWLTGEQVWYSFPAGVEIMAMKYRESGYDAQFDGAFTCNDPFYNVLWEKARRTLYLNMRDNFMDCPTRERAMWWGDVVLESLQSYYVFSPRVHNLTQKAIKELVAWQTDQGVLYSPIPGPHPPLPFGPHRELPLQSLAAISTFSLGNYYRFTEDKATLIQIYPSLKKYLSLWHLGKDGLVEHRKGQWDWQDWGKDIDVPLLDNTWYYSALQSVKKIAMLAGLPGDTSIYENNIKSIEVNFNRAYWKGDAYRSDGYKGKTDDRGNAMAVLTGLAGVDKWPAVTKILETQYNASPYMEKYVVEGLFKMEAPKSALLRMKNRYTKMVESNVSTLWETWDLKFDNTVNHGWSGGPLSLLMQYTAGIEPSEAGFRCFSVNPQLGDLKTINCAVPTRYGTIHLAVNNQGDKYHMVLTVPKGSQASIPLSSIGYDQNHILYINQQAVTRQWKNANAEIGKSNIGKGSLIKLKEGEWDLAVKE